VRHRVQEKRLQAMLGAVIDYSSRDIPPVKARTTGASRYRKPVDDEPFAALASRS